MASGSFFITAGNAEVLSLSDRPCSGSSSSGRTSSGSRGSSRGSEASQSLLGAASHLAAPAQRCGPAALEPADATGGSGLCVTGHGLAVHAVEASWCRRAEQLLLDLSLSSGCCSGGAAGSAAAPQDAGAALLLAHKCRRLQALAQEGASAGVLRR